LATQGGDAEYKGEEHFAPQAGAVLWEGSTLEELTGGFVDHRDGDRRFVGSTPIKTFMRTHLRFRSYLCRYWRVKGILTSGVAPISVLSHSARRVLYGGTQAENKATHLSWATGSSRAIPATGDLEA